MDIVRRDFDHPDVSSLVAEVQVEYAGLYGTPDEAPIAEEAFVLPNGAFHVGYLDSEPVSTGAWKRIELTAFGVADCAEIKRMFTRSGFRRRGLSKLMLAHLESTARDAGVQALVLETGLRQPEAIALYTSSGYQPIPTFGYYADEPLCRCFGKLL